MYKLTVNCRYNINCSSVTQITISILRYYDNEISGHF